MAQLIGPHTDLRTMTLFVVLTLLVVVGILEFAGVTQIHDMHPAVGHVLNLARQ